MPPKSLRPCATPATTNMAIDDEEDVPTISLLEVAAIRPDGSHWAVPVRTMRQAFKVARKLRWQKGWPA